MVVNINGTITPTDVIKINNAATGSSTKVVLVLKNTKYQRSDLIGQLNNNVEISVKGGLNPIKKKFNNTYYQERTIYTPQELSIIISKFESIERQINPVWTESQKCMFVYEKLCDHLNYAQNPYKTFNGRDYYRNLLGMINGESVCSGIAIIFKEAMDRIGIECIYQNRQSHHSWNVVKTGGEYHAMDLTWDVYEKNNGKCKYNWFCRENDFYKNKHHDLSDEEEETIYPVNEIPIEELRSNLRVISENIISRFEMQTIKNIKGEEVSYCKTISKDGKDGYIISYFDNIPYYVMVPSGNDLKVAFTEEQMLIHQNPNSKSYTRNDDSGFCVATKKGNKKVANLNEYYYMEVRDAKGKKIIKRTRIFSENDLINPEEKENAIANSLIRKERIVRKITGFNGYVGYIGDNGGMYYNQSTEEDIIHVIR